MQVWVPVQDTAHPHYFKGCLNYEHIGQSAIYLIHYLISESDRVSICVVEYWNVDHVDNDGERYKIVKPTIGFLIRKLPPLN